MRLLLLILSFFVAGASSAQQFSYPAIRSAAYTIEDFIPQGWMILDSATGDLNKDKLNDAAIVLLHKDSILWVGSGGDTVTTQPRMLIILFQHSAGGFTLVEQNNTLIMIDDGNAYSDNPFQDISISKGILELQFHFMGTSLTGINYKFRYQQNDFVLIGADRTSRHRASADFEQYSYNFLTKKRSLTKGNDETGTEKTTWKNVNIPQLKTLKTLKEPFSWEVEKYVYL